jgi:Tol biopolymer transport system component
MIAHMLVLVLAAAGAATGCTTPDADARHAAAFAVGSDTFPAAGFARATATAPGATATTRRVWADARDYASPSPDGRLIAFVDWSTGDVAVHDLATGQDRRITDKGSWEENGSWAEWPKFSADGRRVVYAYGNTGHGSPFTYEVRYVELGDTTQHLLIRTDAGDDWIAPAQWHATAGVLAVRYRADGSIRLGTITGPGQFNTIRTFNRQDGHPRATAFSPDGATLAIERRDDVWLMRADGSGERRLDLAPARFLGWAPGGDAVLIHAERAGERGIWSVPVANGRRAGEPALVRAGIPSLIPSGVAGDRYFYGVPVDGRRVFMAGVDVEAGRVLVRPTALTTPGDGSARDPAWSPDGRSFAYIQRPPNGDIRIMLRSENGEHAREIASTRYSMAGSLTWARDGRSLFVVSEGLRGPALYRIHLDDGRWEKLLDPAGRHVAILPDESGVVFAGAGSISHLDFASGATRVVAQRRNNGDVAVTPDGRHVAFPRRLPDGSRISMVPLHGDGAGGAGGGDAARQAERELVRLPVGEHIELISNSLRFTPDGRFLLAVVGDDDQHHHLVAFPVDGGPRRVLLDFGQRTDGPEMPHARLHPDGRRIVYAHGDDRAELWVLDSLTPQGR